MLIPQQSLAKRRGSAPVSLPTVQSADNNVLPAGGGLCTTDVQSGLRRGSVPVEIVRQQREYILFQISKAAVLINNCKCYLRF